MDLIDVYNNTVVYKHGRDFEQLALKISEEIYGRFRESYMGEIDNTYLMALFQSDIQARLQYYINCGVLEDFYFDLEYNLCHYLNLKLRFVGATLWYRVNIALT
jgi:hypothetical protein